MEAAQISLLLEQLTKRKALKRNFKILLIKVIIKLLFTRAYPIISKSKTARVTITESESGGTAFTFAIHLVIRNDLKVIWKYLIRY